MKWTAVGKNVHDREVNIAQVDAETRAQAMERLNKKIETDDHHLLYKMWVMGGRIVRSVV